MRPWVLAAIVPLLVTACVAPKAMGIRGRSLDGLLTFDNPRLCTTSSGLESVIKTVLRDTTEEPVRTGPVEVPTGYLGTVDEPEVRRLFNGKLFEAISILHGNWLGLPAKAIAVRGYLGGDGAGFDILFDVDHKTAFKALTKAGFAPPRNGEREIDTDGIGIYMSVVTRPEGVGLRCRYE